MSQYRPFHIKPTRGRGKYNSQFNSSRFNNNSRSVFRDAYPVTSLPIDPRRYPQGSRNQPAYGQPTNIQPYSNSSLSTPNYVKYFRLNNASNTNTSSANRYAGALREFSYQLPVRFPGRSSNNGAPLSRYGAPALFPNYSKNKVKPLSVASPNRNNNNNNVNVNPNSEIKGSGYRKTNRTLDEMKKNDWNRNKVKIPSTNEEEIKTQEKFVNTQDDVWKLLINCDNCADKVKEYNSSNFEFFKRQKLNYKDEYSLVDYDDQIRACIANPTHFRATWKLLEILYDDKLLNAYVDERQYSKLELDAFKFNKNLFDFIEINKNLKNIFITTDNYEKNLLIEKQNNAKIKFENLVNIDNILIDVTAIITKLLDEIENIQ